MIGVETTLRLLSTGLRIAARSCRVSTRLLTVRTRPLRLLLGRETWLLEKRKIVGENFT